MESEEAKVDVPSEVPSEVPMDVSSQNSLQNPSDEQPAKKVKKQENGIKKALRSAQPKRHQHKVYRPISKGAFYRLAQRAGNKRVSGLVYEESRGLLRKYVDRIVGRAVVYMEHSKRKTLKTKDVLASLQGVGHDLYGFQ